MNIETKLTISDLEDLLLLEINERVKKYFIVSKEEYSHFKESDIELMKIDRETLNEGFNVNSEAIVINLKSKLDFLIKLAEEDLLLQ